MKNEFQRGDSEEGTISQTDEDHPREKDSAAAENDKGEAPLLRLGSWKRKAESDLVSPQERKTSGCRGECPIVDSAQSKRLHKEAENAIGPRKSRWTSARTFSVLFGILTFFQRHSLHCLFSSGAFVFPFDGAESM